MENLEKLTNSIQEKSIERDLIEENTDEGGLYPPSRVISTISPVVVRQDNPNGPTYQEALGYRFLINRCAFPGLTSMDNGKLVLTPQAMLEPLSAEKSQDASPVGLLLFSDDDGMSWTQPKRIGMRRCTPFNLGGEKLMLHGFSADDDSKSYLCFSDDAGSTWGKPEPIPALPDGRFGHTDVAYHPLVEGDTVIFLLWSPVEPGYSNLESGELFTEIFLRRYHLSSHSWDEPVFLPRKWGLNEGSLIRAKDGALVAAIRTQMVDQTPPDDHWMGMATTRSMDEGKTWTTPARHYHYGHHHCSLVNLSDGRILLTYVARIGQLEGRTYHGLEAVLSHDNGVTWDWEHRYIIFRTSDNCPHSPQSVLLSDGRILTIFMDHTRSSWTDHPKGDRTSKIFHGVSRVSVVIWSI
jgi:hypothetical protein